MAYNHQEIEQKWQKFWADNKTFKAENNSDKPKYYALDMFPYPSGAGLHVGHPLGYTATDIISRKKRMEGKNVLHPIGWDAFGLPAENYAIKTGVHPNISTQENIKNFTSQIKALGFSYDWDREVDTTDPQYYKWSQWLFLQLYKKGLLYEDNKPMNWCPKCKVVCANEEVEQGQHERCGEVVEKKALKQWMFRITDYADRLLKDLDKPNVLFLHGWGGGGKIGWFGEIKNYLEKNNIECLNPDFPNTDMPIYSDWKKHFEQNISSKINSNTIVIGHSLGCGFMQRYLTEENLKIAELIFVAPTVGDCGLSEIKNFFEKENGVLKEKRGQKFHSKGESVGPSLFDSILWENLKEVKKKKNKKLRFSEIKKKVIVGEKNIFFDGETLISHFNNKPQHERRTRLFLGRTIISALDKLYFESETVGYFLSQNRVIKVILSKVTEEDYFVKTFYESKKLTKFYKKNKEALNSQKFIFDYKKIKNSADNIFIFGGGKDPYIKKSEFEFLANKLDARFIFSEKEGHFGGESILENFQNKDILGYFEKLVAGILDWPEKIKAMQRNWIGKSEGANVDFEIEGEKVTVYTTRPDTLFGATYMVLSPEHPLVSKIITEDKKQEVKNYKKEVGAKSDLERTELNKDKTGVFTGAYAINPVNKEKIPVWIADYVLMSYGTGAIMAVPAHDERDFEFAEKYKIKIIKVVKPSFSVCINYPIELISSEIEKKFALKRANDSVICSFSGYDALKKFEKLELELKTNKAEIIKGMDSFEFLDSDGICFSSKTSGIINNSDFLNGLSIEEAKEKIIKWLEEKGLGERKINYKLRDWIFTRQRYWGEPIPFVFDESGKCFALADSELPVILPDTPNYAPSASGESPLSKIEEWVNVKGDVQADGTVVLSDTGKINFKRETSTMPNWAGSSWYWLRYMDSVNDQEFCSKENSDYWGPVDLYVGGAEHAVLHLLYARFWHKAMYDMGLVSTKEPFKKLVNQGMIISYAYENSKGGLIPIDEVEEKDGKYFIIESGDEVKKISAKMSKSLKNVVNPDDIVEKFGADTLRVYEMFMGPFDQSKTWEEGALAGMRRFLDKIHRTFMEKEIAEACPDKKLISLTHKTVKLVTEDVDNFKFNTAISHMMVWMNEFSKLDAIPKIPGGKFIRMLAPFAPHLAEEIWTSKFKTDVKTITFEHWPTYREEFLVEDSVTYAVQVNGKLRADFEISKDANKEEVIAFVKNIEKVQKYLEEGDIKKEIFVPGKIVGFVVR